MWDSTFVEVYSTMGFDHVLIIRGRLKSGSNIFGVSIN